jgi:hypothetical protein
VTPCLNKLAFNQRNTKQNPYGKQTMPVSDPEKILKARGSLKTTTAVYQLMYPQSNTKSSFEPSTLHNPLPETINPTLTLFEVKSEIHPTTSGVHKGKNPAVNLSEIDIPPTFQLDFTTPPSLEEYTIYSDSTPMGSPDFISCKSKEPSPCISFHSPSLFSSLEEARNLLLVFQNPLYNTPFPYSVVPMEAIGGGGGVALGGGVGGQGPTLPPIVFAKVAVRYAPLVLPVPLHDLPKNYIKTYLNLQGKGT